MSTIEPDLAVQTSLVCRLPIHRDSSFLCNLACIRTRHGDGDLAMMTRELFYREVFRRKRLATSSQDWSFLCVSTHIIGMSPPLNL